MSAGRRLPIGEVLVGDCVAMLHDLPEASVDLVFADPPYNLQLWQPLFRPDRSRVDGVDDAWDRFPDLAAYDQFTRAWLAACQRVLKPTGTLWVIGDYHNIYRIGTALHDLDFWILNEIAWIKTNAMPNFRGTRFANAHETLIWAQKQRGAPYTFNYHTMKEMNGGRQMRSDWALPHCSAEERLRVNGEKAHSTQKPLALLERIILASSRPGDLVLDPFFGTGTTGAAAKRLGRGWIGIERDAGYAELARGRIATVEPMPLEDLPAPGERRKLPRVLLTDLMASAHLAIDQPLRFLKPHGPAATVLADGRLQSGDTIGTLHMVARTLHGGPCNGWTAWLWHDAVSGRYRQLDDLRQAYLANQAPGA